MNWAILFLALLISTLIAVILLPFAAFSYNAVEEPQAFWAEVTGYSSTIDQTDSDPFTTASGQRVYDGGIACPSWLKFGDRVEIEGKEYECNDVMNKRYREGKYFDIWYPTREEALKAGRERLAVKILDI